MHKNFFNPYKHKKKWGRGFKKASNFVFTSSSDMVKKKDFDWKRRKQNPFWHDTEDVDWKKRIEIGIFVSALITILLLAIYHPFFHIKKIEISGLQRITKTEVEDSVFGVIDYHRWLILPGKSYFIVNLDEIRDILKERFPIESIIVKKTFPNIININIEEKISTIIYDNGYNYSYIGTDGNVVEILRKVGDDEWNEKTKITTSTDESGEIKTHTEVIEKSHIPQVRDIVSEMGDYPIIFDKCEKTVEINTKVLDSNTVFGIINWFNLINKRTDIPFGYMIIENEIGDGIIKTREGWEIRVKLSQQDIEKQLTELKYILKEKLDRNNLNYIDLRYLGKVYWQ